VKAAHDAHIARGQFLFGLAHGLEAAKVHAAAYSSAILGDPSH
jgi:hypothetical protein